MKNNKQSDGNKENNLFLMILVLVALIAVAFVIWLVKKDDDGGGAETQEASAEETEDLNQGYINYNGEKYAYNSNLKTMLFLGIDKDETATVRDVTGRSGQSDCMILLVMDQEDKTITLLEISRDTMVDVDIYGIDGDYMDTQTAQIATQYAYGTGDKDSCKLSLDAVENLLYGIRINDYLSLNMAGIPPIVDSIGGVEITIPEDYTWIDPAFEKNATLNLTGEQAYWYVRKRDTDVLGSNNDRMERQTQFIQALFTKVSESDDNGLSMVRSFWTSGEDYMTTNLSLKTLEKLTSYTMEPDIIKIPGEVRAGEEHDEFYADEEELRQIVIDTFYKKL